MKPQLAIRDLFWLVLVFAISLAWMLDRTRLSKSSQSATRAASLFQGQLRLMGYEAKWDAESAGVEFIPEESDPIINVTKKYRDRQARKQAP